MYQRMLVPLDKLNLEMFFVHVCSESAMKFVCRSYIEHVAELAKTNISAHGEVIVGDPAKAIIKYGETNRIDLMLIATHGQSGLGGWAIGSIAHKLITLSKMPIFLIRPHAGETQISKEWPKKVLMPLDGSSLAESVLLPIETISQQGNSRLELTLLRVCESRDLISDYPEASMPLSWEEHVKAAMAAAEHSCGIYLDDIQTRLQTSGIQTNSQVILGDKDNVSQNIVDYTNKGNYDLIAMSTHGRSAISVWPYGHVADRLVQVLSVPLLLVHPEKTE